MNILRGADSEGAEPAPLPPLGDGQTPSLYPSPVISSLISSQMQMNMEAFSAEMDMDRVRPILPHIFMHFCLLLVFLLLSLN